MTITTTPHAAAFRRYREQRAAAVQFTNPDLNPAALTRRRSDLARAAKAELAGAIPPLPDQTGPTRADVLASRAPRTADEVAVAQHELGKVLQLLDAGRSLTDIIASADGARAAAIADGIETLPDVLTRGDGAMIAEETRARVFDRLVQLGAPDAVAASVHEQESAPILAWHRVMTGLVEGDLTLDARSALYRADPEGYAQTFSADSGDVDTIEHRARQLESSPLPDPS